MSWVNWAAVSQRRVGRDRGAGTREEGRRQRPVERRLRRRRRRRSRAAGRSAKHRPVLPQGRSGRTCAPAPRGPRRIRSRVAAGGRRPAAGTAAISASRSTSPRPASASPRRRAAGKSPAAAPTGSPAPSARAPAANSRAGSGGRGREPTAGTRRPPGPARQKLGLTIGGQPRHRLRLFGVLPIMVHMRRSIACLALAAAFAAPAAARAATIVVDTTEAVSASQCGLVQRDHRRQHERRLRRLHRRQLRGRRHGSNSRCRPRATIMLKARRCRRSAASWRSPGPGAGASCWSPAATLSRAVRGRVAAALRSPA